MKQGLIALDIDGTLTDESHLIPDKVIEYLGHLEEQGWQMILLTGRPFSYASRAVHSIKFPFYLALQNGADILKMPDKTLVDRAYLEKDTIEELDRLYQTIPSDFLIYSGYDSGDFCFFRSKKFPASMASYLSKLQTLTDAPWQDCQNFQLEQKTFPLVKCIGRYDEMANLQAKLKHMNTTLIRDPVSDGYYHLILVTHPLATKGKALQRMQSHLGITEPIIAAGDDTNDIPMLQEANIAIVMETAPKEVLPFGDIIAKPSSELGIIAALQTAIAQC